MRTVCIVQQRMGSTRLPGKALLPLAGKSLTQNLLERVKRATKLDAVVLAVPRKPENECLWQVAHDAGCEFYWYSGDENDLVGRYLACAKSFDADIVVRVPGDNPCVEPEYIDKAIQAYLNWPMFWYSNADAEEVSGHWFDGIGCEVFSVSRLKWLDVITQDMGSPYREHPHLLFHERAERAAKWSEAIPVTRLDVNDRRDYEFIKSIYDFFGNNTFSIEQVLEFLDTKSCHAARN